MYGLSKCVVIFIILSRINTTAHVPPTCDSKIYCHGQLLQIVQTSGIFADSKTFVDMTMLHDPEIILQDFQKLLAENNGTLEKHQVSQFVDKNFISGVELEEWLPEDYSPSPPFLNTISHPDIRAFAEVIVSIWPKLGRKVGPSVLSHPQRHSIIPLPNGMIVPGGRFRESYYWDTYWIIKGLLVSEMYATVRGLLDNFVYLVKKFGFIPNGSRVYYSRRSQPPLFLSMCMEYFLHTGDLQWLQDKVEYMEQELVYWQGRMIKVNAHMMARYLPLSEGPRSESYKEDLETASIYPELERQRIYADLKGGAESGWDFSSRWFYSDHIQGMVGNLSHINTQRTLPVDLNAYLCKAFRDLSHFYSIVGNRPKQSYWHAKYRSMKSAIFDIFWNATDGVWYDYDLKLGKHRCSFYVSNISPMWAAVEHEEAHKGIYGYLERQGIFDYFGGTPTSLQHTGEQWDYPNAWAPLQSIVITALQRGKSQKSRNMAKYLAKLWIEANAIGFKDSGELYEKYDALIPGKYGGGGEYVVQAGFGWTNGFALDLIKQYYAQAY